jgi:hypothetical protein
MGYVLLAAGVEIIHAEHFIAFSQEPFAQMRAQKSGSAGDEDSLAASAFHAPIISERSLP